MLKFILCDDNQNILNQLSIMLESIFFKNDLEAEVIFKTTTEAELLNYINKNSFDVVILDIQLSTKSAGIDLANEIRKHNKDCYIIFTTDHSKYVFLESQYKTFDYICKPLTKERLEETILRLFSDIKGSISPNKYIKLDNKNTIINGNDVQYIKRDGMKVIFHTTSKDYEIYSSFAKLQSQLPSNFVRCHKSFIANIDNIDKLEPVSNLIHFKNNATCEIGPKYKKDLMKGVSSNGNIF